MARSSARAGRSDSGGPGAPSPPLIDRLTEMHALRSELARVAGEGRCRTVVLIGESGIGKSRLVAEVAAEAGRAGLRIVGVRCIGRGGEPLLPIREALATHLGRSPERIRRSLLTAAPWLLDFVPFVGSFLGRLGEEVLGSGKLGGASAQGVYEGVSRVLLGIASKQGLLLAVEDLHAADPDTLYFLNYLLSKAGATKLLVVVTVQEEQLAVQPMAELLEQWRKAGHRSLPVPPLARPDVGPFIAAVAGRSVAEASVAERLFRLTGGNPFFLQESIGWYAQHPDRLDQPVAQLEAILQHRLAQVDEDTRAFLDAAAVVLETTQELDPVAYALDVDEGQAVRLFGRASRSRLMTEDAGGQIAFQHDLTRQAVYRQLGGRQRAYLHARAGLWHAGQRRFAPAAHHFERAGRAEDMVTAALAAAEQAEHTGLYHSALLHLQKARPYRDFAEIGPRLGKANLMLGRWPEVDAILASLPRDDARARLLRSEYRFVTGDFTSAGADAEQALQLDPALAVEALVRLADVHLYLGNFDTTRTYAERAAQAAEQAAEAAEPGGSLTDRVRCQGILGATLLFGGAVEHGEDAFRRALDLLLTCPEDERDRPTHATLLDNLGSARDVQGDWPAALDYHGQALRLRREVFDARGLLHSLHGVARSEIGLGQTTRGLRHLDEASQLATDLGEPLERAKIVHTQAELAARNGHLQDAVALAEQALAAFGDCGTSYDVAHARLTLARLYEANGQHRAAVERAAAGRAAVERKGFGLLTRLYPDLTAPVRDRIAAALIGYACGDAFGLPWEGQPPSGISLTAARQFPQRPGWTTGATSDDTALTLLVAEHLAQYHEVRSQSFLTTLAERAHDIPGLGPTTTAAIEHATTGGTPPSAKGHTNGAAMRALPIGWATPIDAADQRRRWALALSAATHPSPEAQCAAAIVAACGAWAVEGANAALLLDIATDEAAAAVRATSADRSIVADLQAVGRHAWGAPADGISLHPYPTVLAVLYCIYNTTNLRQAVEAAVTLGGDTDTVAALVAGLLAARHTAGQVRAELPWSSQVQLPDNERVRRLATGLADLRLGRADG